MLYGDGIHDDTLALQAMLDGCGVVTVDKPGTYLISKTLLIHSNTRLVLSPGAKPYIDTICHRQCNLRDHL